MIKFKKINKKLSAQFQLKNINFEASSGECLYLVGENGSGKTSVLNILLGLLSYDSGTIEESFLKGDVGVVLKESPGFYPQLTCLENVKYVSSLFGKCDLSYFNELASKFHLDEHKNRQARDLSTGMKAKLSLILAMIQKPKLLILDEPTLGFDSQSIKKVSTILARYLEQGGCVICATHDDVLLKDLKGRIILMNKGEVLSEYHNESLINSINGNYFEIELTKIENSNRSIKSCISEDMVENYFLVENKNNNLALAIEKVGAENIKSITSIDSKIAILGKLETHDVL